MPVEKTSSTSEQLLISTTFDTSSLLRTLSARGGCLQRVRYGDKPIPLLDYPVLNEENMHPLMSYKSARWEYEQEWRLIVELNETTGTGRRDGRCQPITCSECLIRR